MLLITPVRCVFTGNKKKYNQLSRDDQGSRAFVIKPGVVIKGTRGLRVYLKKGIRYGARGKSPKRTKNITVGNLKL